MKKENGVTLIVTIIMIILIIAKIALWILLANKILFWKIKKVKIDNDETVQQNSIDELEKSEDEPEKSLDDEENVTEEKNEENNITTIEIPSDMKIGDIVNYTPNTDVTSYDLTSEKSGFSNNQTVSKETYIWKVLSLNKDSIDIVGVPESSMYAVWFARATGYNNGVYLLNEICEQLYSNNVLGVTARSINVDDIESKMNNVGKSVKNEYKHSFDNIQYGQTKTYTMTSYNGKSATWYPKLAKYENCIEIDGTAQNDGIGESHNGSKQEGIKIPLLESDINTYKNSKMQAKTLTVKNTYYEFTPSKTYFDDENFYDLIFETGTSFWLASRYTCCKPDFAYFGIRGVGYNDLFGGYGLFNSCDDIGGLGVNNEIAPVISLKSDIKFSKTSDGTWDISKDN